MRELFVIKAPKHNAWCFSTRARLLAQNFKEAKIFNTKHEARDAIDEIMQCLKGDSPRYTVYDAPDEVGYFNHNVTPLELEVEVYTLTKQ